ncbi:MAG: carboxypeptidase-like regulatory domain-containing protein, partial [Bacteroidales bacterium]|nr:carboxypeptidase-like regulatory domain-containing protein [Bacteroidales bacterium]
MRKIKVFFAAMALLVTALAYGQNITVTGTVSDSSTGEAVPFASIQLKGTMTGASADVNGSYSISVPANGTLIFSSIGYLNQEVPVAGRAVHNVALDPDAEALDETIVVAFGTTTKSSFTGSAAVVNSEKLEKVQTASVTNALAGAVAGVQLTSSNGAPG